MLPYKILALGGGGTKGFMHIGALKELESRMNIQQLYGCSVGSLFATGLAFGLSVKQLQTIAFNHLKLNDLVNFKHLSDAIQKKGLIKMDEFESRIIEGFQSEGMDLRNKTISQAKIPLHIIATNISKGVPTVFQGNVPVIQAIKASCCIPFLFRPQQINNSLYIDGGAITNIIMKTIPKHLHSETLAICLTQPHHHITPLNIESMTPLDYVYKLYKTVCAYEHLTYEHPNIVRLYHSNTNGFTDLSLEDKEDMVLAGRCIMRDFLAQRRL